MTNKETITKLKNDIQHFQQQYEKAITALIDSAREIETLRNRINTLENNPATSTCLDNGGKGSNCTSLPTPHSSYYEENDWEFIP